MKSKYSALGLLLISLLFILSSCGVAEPVSQRGSAGNSLPVEGSHTLENQGDVDEPPAFPVTFTDASGTKITLEREPARIVSILPSNTENAWALGLGGKMVGVSDWDNYPEEVNDVEKIGGLQDPNIEKIIDLDPDLVLAGASSNEKAIDPLRDVGLSVLVLPKATHFDGVFETLRMLGQATGTVEQAEQVISHFQEKKESISAKVADIPESEKVRVWIEISPDLHTAGSNTFIHDIVQLSGGINVAAEVEGWAQMSEEQVIQWAPEVIISTYGYYTGNPEEQIQTRTAWADVPAVKNGRVYDIHNDLLTRPGPRLIDGMEEVAKLLYPERF